MAVSNRALEVPCNLSCRTPVPLSLVINETQLASLFNAALVPVLFVVCIRPLLPLVFLVMHRVVPVVVLHPLDSLMIRYDASGALIPTKDLGPLGKYLLQLV